MAEKRYLFTPGPTPVPPEVLAALAEPVVHHRGPDYRAVFGDCLEKLQAGLPHRADVLLFTCSGTGAMESAVSNLCSPGDRVVVVSAGSFGERWQKLAAAFGCEVDAVAYEWGETPSADDLAARLDELGGAKAVFVTHSETSTGVVADLQALAAAAKPTGALVVADAVSSLGAVPLETDAWGIDVVCSGSQKALMTPPGLGLVAVSPAAWEALGSSPRFYFDWEKTRAGQEKLDSAFTPGGLARARARRRARAAARRGARDTRSTATSGSAAPAARARRRWASSSSRPTRTARPSSPRSARPRGSTPPSSRSRCATATA